MAYIVSHSDGVVNDKAALTQRLASMGATVAGRFSGLITHIIFRCKPHASKEERLAEGQSLFELYKRIDKVSLLLHSARNSSIHHGIYSFWGRDQHFSYIFLVLSQMIVQAHQQRQAVPQVFIVAPFWIEACLINGAHAPVRPMLHANGGLSFHFGVKLPSNTHASRGCAMMSGMHGILAA
jgi:hypothetical protein